ncbi:MAG: UTP--glucose-phosphate uridylyltransferase [Candidatus Saccharibacteria bacterium]|nr:UTP--glucose-phosphate uridylyltransferase [Candidatus Saccharibacteria bacterium]
MSQPKKVKKAVIAAAGFGTRFLPQTKAMPKEMLPLVDKPIIQYIVEDLVAAGVKDIIIVTGYSKRSIEDHFDNPNEDLLNNLRAGGADKAHYIDEITKVADMANFAYVRQKGPYGTATPIMNAAHLIGDEPFIYTFADDLTVATPNMFQQMISLYEEFESCILPCIRVNEDADFARYGIVEGSELRSDVMKVSGIIEKPGREKAPSNFASVGGYLLTPDVFTYLEKGKQQLQPGQEFYATDSVLQPMLHDGISMYGCEIMGGSRYDTGNPLDYLKTVFDFAMEREDIGPDLTAYLRDKLQ